MPTKFRSALRDGTDSLAQGPLHSAAMALGVLACACSSDSEGLASAQPEGDARYLVSMGIVTPTGATGLVFPLESLDEDAEFDREEALEVPGAGFLAAIPDTNDFLIASGEEPSLTRYSYGSDGFAAGAAFSLSSFGANEPIRAIAVIDERRGFIAISGGAIFEFDPAEMAVSRELVLEDFARDGFYPAAPSTYGRSFRRRESLFFVYSWWNDPDGAIPLSETALVHVDLDSGQATASFLQGCGDLDSGAVDRAGNLWLASAGYGASARVAAPSEAPETCLLRLEPGATRIDEAEVTQPWVREAAPLADLLSIDGNEALVREFDSSAELAEPVDTYAVAGSASWRWGRIDLGTREVTSEPALPAGSVPTTAFSVGSSLYAGAVAPDYSETTFTKVAADEVRAGITLPGFPISLVEIGTQ